MASAMVQVNVRIPPDLHAQLVKHVAQSGHSQTRIVNNALRSYLAKGRR